MFITVPEALTLRASRLRFFRNFRKLTAKNTTKFGNLPKRYDFVASSVTLRLHALYIFLSRKMLYQDSNPGGRWSR